MVLVEAGEKGIEVGRCSAAEGAEIICRATDFIGELAGVVELVIKDIAVTLLNSERWASELTRKIAHKWLPARFATAVTRRGLEPIRGDNTALVFNREYRRDALDCY